VSARRFEFAEAQAVGAQYVRIDLDQWAADSGAFDVVVADAKDYGLQVMAILFSGGGPVTPTTAYDFAYQQASRLAGKVWMFEFVNEPNGRWTGTEYGEALVSAYDGLKTGNPNAIMIAGSMGGSANMADILTFVNAMYAAGAKGHFDYFSMHLYGDPDNTVNWGYGDDTNWQAWSMWPWALFPNAGTGNKCVRQILDEHGDSAIPIISTEMGLAATNPETGVSDAYYNETNQVTVINHDFDHLFSGDIASIAIYRMVDDPNELGAYGLDRADHTRRPAWDAYYARANVGK
jgi:hypothetical protein